MLQTPASTEPGPRTPLRSAIREASYVRLPAQCPRMRWPGAARVALWVSLHLGFPGEEGARLRPAQCAGRPAMPPSGRDELAWGVSLWRVADVLAHYPVAVTAASHAAVLEARPDLVELVRGRAWELMDTGPDQPPPAGVQLADALRQRAERLREFAGRQPSGLRDPGPASGPDALDAVAEAGFRYLAGCLHDDVPVPLKTAHGLLWSVPCRGPTGELAPVPGPLDADVFAQTACDHFDRLWHEADEEDEALVCCLPLDPRLIGQPHAVGALRRVLDHLCGHDFVWHAQAGAIVEAAQRSHEGHADFEAWLREGRS
jgi:allantoinase